MKFLTTSAAILAALVLFVHAPAAAQDKGKNGCR